MATTTKTTTENSTTENSSTANGTDVPELASTLRDQLLTAVTTGQQLSVDAVRTWTRGVSALSRPDAVDGVGTRAADGATSATGFAYDVASDLLGAQRDFALAMARTVSGRPQT